METKLQPLVCQSCPGAASPSDYAHAHTVLLSWLHCKVRGEGKNAAEQRYMNFKHVYAASADD